jgi:DNA-binding response OmpR family regulator
VRLLLVEDEPGMAAALVRGLGAEGYVVDHVTDGRAGLEAARFGAYDVVVLDIMLPALSGYSVVRTLRQEENWVPVLLLSAKDGEHDVADGLDYGADDYLTKPFSMRELTARVHVLLRRVERAAATPPAIRLGDIEINEAERRVRRAGSDVHLTPTEFDLLVHLAGRPRTVLPRERLLADVWGWGDGNGTRTVDSHIKALRRKLGADLIRTVHGVGYALELPL